MEEGVAGRGFMKCEGVLGGSMFGITFFHDSMKPESALVVVAAGTSVAVEKGLLLNLTDPAKRREPCRNIMLNC